MGGLGVEPGAPCELRSLGETYYAIQRAMLCDTITGGVGLWQASKERLPAGRLREEGKESDLTRLPDDLASAICRSFGSCPPGLESELVIHPSPLVVRWKARSD